MNIFMLDSDPKQAARYLGDCHVVKMILECDQMLKTGMVGPNEKVGYKNHPCSVWCRASKANYRWLIDHMTEMLKEYTRRYGKVHAYQDKPKTYSLLCKPVSRGLTPAAQCMPDEFKNADPVLAYRAYYRYKADSLVRGLSWYKDRTRVPDWW